MNNSNADFNSRKKNTGFRGKRHIHPSSGGLSPQPEGASPPPHGHPPLQDEKLRARFELDSAYRDLRKGELIIQQIETYLPESEEALLGRELLEIAARIYQYAYRGFQDGSWFKAAEYSAAVKDVMRGIDKFYHTAGPYPIFTDEDKDSI